jgi:probable HAF family extracellular repeat protein
MADLGTLGGSLSVALGINDSGQVAGWSDTDSVEHAFLWTESGGMKDLGTLGGGFSGAIGINNSGQVVGESETASGEILACMWIPQTPETMLAGMAVSIMDEADSGNIDTQLEGSLLAKVKAALAALDRGNPNDVKAAINNLNALINEVQAQSGKKITPQVATEIIQKAKTIIAELGG